MCLITEMPCAKIADHDIACFKAVILNEHNKLVTPYQKVKVTKHMIAPNDIQISVHITGRILVEGGFIHAFTTKKIALIETATCKGWIILDAIIPKGTEYFVGIHGDICAREMIVFTNRILPIAKSINYDLDSLR